MTTTHRCCGEKETLDLAVGLAAGLRGGEVFALEGDLGCGKTTFVRGLALGLGCPALLFVNFAHCRLVWDGPAPELYVSVVVV